MDAMESEPSEPSLNCEETPIPMGEVDESQALEPEEKQSIVSKPVSALKKQPDQLCNCPLHCDNKIDKEWRTIIYKQFGDIPEHALQNLYIQRHIKIKSIAQRLWEDEIVEKKVQRRVTCKYLIPMTGTVMESFSYAKTLTYDTVKFSLENALPREIKADASKDPTETPKSDTVNSNDNPSSNDSLAREILPNGVLPTSNGFVPTDEANSTINGLTRDTIIQNGLENSVKENGCEVNSPLSSNDNDSVNTSPEDAVATESDTSAPPSKVKYIEVCQKAFMNMYGITEKRIRWQREKLILKSRYLAEKKKKELEEMDRTLTLARSLGAGCQPLLALLEKSNCGHLSEQLIYAIEDDITLVNNFFHNQLWKPEDIMNKSVYFTNSDTVETEM